MPAHPAPFCSPVGSEAISSLQTLLECSSPSARIILFFLSVILFPTHSHTKQCGGSLLLIYIGGVNEMREIMVHCNFLHFFSEVFKSQHMKSSEVHRTHGMFIWVSETT